MSFDGTSLTYSSLRDRAAQIGQALRPHVSGDDPLVGVCLERSADLPAALLGVFNAGAAYLPLDPHYPAHRLGLIAEDARPVVTLADRASEAKVPQNCPVVWLDEVPALGGQADHTGVTRGPADLAYVIYTSGSTGRPKGVAVEHRNLLWLFDSTAPLFGFSPDDVWTWFHSYSFDFSVWEIFGALLHGGRVAVTPHWTARQPDAFFDLLDREKVTMLSQTPSAFWPLADVDDGRPLALRHVVFGGEKLEVKRLASWVNRRGTDSPRLVNMFGITETTVHVTYRALTREDIEGVAQSPIGKPLPGVDVCVVDEANQPVSTGAVGEMLVAGGGVARGYLHRPDLTAQRFVEGPDGRRFYRSGDLAAMRNDGELEYLGRGDTQVKIRGFRIELGEIEAVIRGHHAVRDAVVELQPSTTGRLVAYLVTRDAFAAADETDLRAYLGTRLPDYMQPVEYVVIGQIPLTENGKVDRTRLPRPVRATRSADLPQTDAERAVCSTLSEMFGTAVGLEDDFFAVGGHSLLAAQLVTRLYDRTAHRLTVQQVFQNSPVSALAALLEQAPDASPGHAGGVPSQQIERTTSEGPATGAQARLWLLEQAGPATAVYTIPWALRLIGGLDRGRLLRAIERIAERHAGLRTRLTQRQDGLHQVIDPPGLMICAEEDWSENPPASDAQLSNRLGTLAERPFTLPGGPLARVTLITLGADDHALLLLVHHAVADGWSMAVIQRDLAAFYNDSVSSVEGSSGMRFLDYAASESARRRVTRTDGSLEWWQGYLRGAPTILDLPTDRVRPGVIDWAGDVVRVTLPVDLTRAINATGARVGATPFMTLFAAWLTVLGQYAGREDFLVGTPVAGRNVPELEDTVGFFANTIVLRADLSGRPTFLEVLERVRRTSLEVYAHQDVPFEQIVELCQPERLANRMPLVQAVFAYQQFPDSTTRFDGLSARNVAVHTRTSKFDCTLSARPVDGAVELELEYATALFNRESMEQVLSRFRQLLETVAATPEIEIVAHGSARAVAPTPRASAVVTDTRPPSTATERAMAAIWTDVLAVGPISRDDSFFGLGGHSLVAATMLFRLGKAFDVHVSLQTLYVCATLHDLAAHVDNLVEKGQRRPAPIPSRRARPE